MARRSLSARDVSILSLASTGKADKQIANELGLSLSTVRTYWGRIREKLGAATRAQAVGLYVRSHATGVTAAKVQPSGSDHPLNDIPLWRAEGDGRPVWANACGTRWLRHFENNKWRDFDDVARKALIDGIRHAISGQPNVVVVHFDEPKGSAHFVLTPCVGRPSEAMVIFVPPRVEGGPSSA